MRRGERYYALLREAHEASDAVDNFDLYSGDPQSMLKWTALLNACNKAQDRLIAYITKKRRGGPVFK